MALMEWHATVYPPHEHIDSEYEYDIHRLMKRWTREVRVNPEVFEIPEDEEVLRFQCPAFLCGGETQRWRGICEGWNEECDMWCGMLCGM